MTTPSGVGRALFESERLQAVTERLLVELLASRVTIRLMCGDADLVLAAESLAPGVASMAGQQLKPENYPTYKYLQEQRRILVQEDCRTARVAPPPSLVAKYRVFAQMLAPVIIGGSFIGTISVHVQGQTRVWTDVDIQRLQLSQMEVQSLCATAPPAFQERPHGTL